MPLGTNTDVFISHNGKKKYILDQSGLKPYAEGYYIVQPYLIEVERLMKYMLDMGKAVPSIDRKNGSKQKIVLVKKGEYSH